MPARTGEFVWNLATMPLAKQMNQTSASVAPEVSEFELAGLTPIPAARVAAARVAESPVCFECKVTQVLQLKDKEGSAMPNWVVFGEVVAAHNRPDACWSMASTTRRPPTPSSGPAAPMRMQRSRRRACSGCRGHPEHLPRAQANSGHQLAGGTGQIGQCAGDRFRQRSRRPADEPAQLPSRVVQ